MRTRVVGSFLLITLLAGAAPALADDGSPHKSGRSTGKRIAWIALGAGAGSRVVFFSA